MELKSKDEIYVSYAPFPDSRQMTMGKTFSVPLFLLICGVRCGIFHCDVTSALKKFQILEHFRSWSFR